MAKYYVHYPSLAAAGLALLTGLLTQIFIVVVNITDWAKGRPKTPVDQILTSLGITRIYFHSISFLDTMGFVFLSGFNDSNVHTFLFLTAKISNLSDIWMGAFFSVIFCLKISNVQNAFFLYLKKLFSQRVVHLMFTSVSVSTCLILLLFITDHVIASNFLFQNFTSNETKLPELRPLYIFITIGNTIPFLIYSTSSLLLIVSLCLHLNRMKSNSNVSSNLDSYYNAIQFMTICLIAFLLRIGLNVVILGAVLPLDIVWLFIIWNLVAILHSIYLIYRTNKLSNRFLKILHHGANCLFRRKGSVSNGGDQENNLYSVK